MGEVYRATPNWDATSGKGYRIYTPASDKHRYSTPNAWVTLIVMRDKELDTLRVYVVDDSALLRQRLVGILTELDHVEVIGEADDRDHAITEVTKLKPQVVILDIQLRQGNGIEVLTQIKKVQPSPTVIMLTNYPYPQFREKCMSAGADYFFYKATEFTKVKEVVRLLASQLHP